MILSGFDLGRKHMSVKIIYQDESIVVCEKAPGVLSQSDVSGAAGLTELLASCPGLAGKQIYPVHRLDRPVGGVMVFALNRRACAYLSKQAEADEALPLSVRPLRKVYLAVVSGRPEPEHGEMCDLMYRDSAKNKSFIVSGQRKGVKRARLEYSLVKTAEMPDKVTVSLVRIELDTGRTHQIRAQFSHRGMPIAGDGKYGSRIKTENIALWSYQLDISHPKSGKRMTFVSKPPSDGVWSLFNSDFLTAF